MRPQTDLDHVSHKETRIRIPELDSAFSSAPVKDVEILRERVLKALERLKTALKLDTAAQLERTLQELSTLCSEEDISFSSEVGVLTKQKERGGRGR